MNTARLKVLEQQLRDLSLEHELLLQAFEKVNAGFHLTGAAVGAGSQNLLGVHVDVCVSDRLRVSVTSC